MMSDLSHLSDRDIIATYCKCIRELRERKIITTNNVVGELGEHYAIECFNNTPGLQKLSKTPVSTKNIDAIGRDGKTYSIKSITRNTTGVIHGLNPPDSNSPDKKIFDYMIICKFNKNLELETIYQIDWETFGKHKKWHKTMKAYNITINEKFIKDSKIVYQTSINSSQDSF